VQIFQSFKDQIGNSVIIPWPPSRIVSLVPSQTELLSDLNLSAQVVGITKYCVWPTQWKKTKVCVGGTKDFNVEKILNLNPDLVIGNKEENQKELIEQLLKHVPLWMSDIETLGDAMKMIKEVGAITNRNQEAEIINKKIDQSFKDLIPFAKTQKSVLYLIWRKPWMGVGTNTFINDMLDRIGLINCLKNEHRYLILNPNKLASLDPDIIFLSSEPYPFVEKHLAELNELFPASKIVLIDGQMFSWYGSRLLYAADYFKSLSI
jgi:ABC-type Fe3+-hydroxamate transport system substrate-binding protein